EAEPQLRIALGGPEQRGVGLETSLGLSRGAFLGTAEESERQEERGAAANSDHAREDVEAGRARQATVSSGGADFRLRTVRRRLRSGGASSCVPSERRPR